MFNFFCWQNRTYILLGGKAMDKIMNELKNLPKEKIEKLIEIIERLEKENKKGWKNLGY